MREIFKKKIGKDFYRNELEYMEYDPEIFERLSYKQAYKYESSDITDDEMSFIISQKISHKLKNK